MALPKMAELAEYEVYDSTEEDMTYDEKRDLVMDIVKEPDMKVVSFIRIVESRQPGAIVRTGDDAMEIDFDKLHASTLRAVEVKVKQHQAAVEEKTASFRGLHKLTGEALQAKICKLEVHLAKLDQYLGCTYDRKTSRDAKKMRKLLDKGRLDPEARRNIRDLFQKYSSEDMPIVGGDSSSDEDSSDNSDTSGWSTDSDDLSSTSTSSDDDDDGPRNVSDKH